MTDTRGTRAHAYSLVLKHTLTGRGYTKQEAAEIIAAARKNDRVWASVMKHGPKVALLFPDSTSPAEGDLSSRSL